MRAFGIFTAIAIGLIATTAGGVFIDLFSGVTPEIVRPAQQARGGGSLARLLTDRYATTRRAIPFSGPRSSRCWLRFSRFIVVREHWGPLMRGLVLPAQGTGAGR